jgi:hypothetical protein
MKEWECVYVTSNLQNAEMIKSILSLESINSVIICKQDSSYLFGEHEVHVNRNDIIRSKYILKNNFNSPIFHE